MTFHCCFRVEELPRLQGKLHWRAVAAERIRWRDVTLWAIREAGIVPPSVPLERARLTFTRHSPMRPDDDNLAVSFKSVRDALIGILIRDDSPAVIGTPDYRWEKAPPRKGFVTVEVREGWGPACPACGQAVAKPG